MADFDSKLRPRFEGLLEEGETLDGICACAQQKGLFSGGAVALGITPGRLLVQSLTRRGDPDGDPLALAAADITEAKAGGAGDGWADIGSAIMDRHAIKLTLQITSGEKLKLMLMRAEGDGAMAILGGGEGQRRGVEALSAWFARNSGQGPGSS